MNPPYDSPRNLAVITPGLEKASQKLRGPVLQQVLDGTTEEGHDAERRNGADERPENEIPQADTGGAEHGVDQRERPQRNHAQSRNRPHARRADPQLDGVDARSRPALDRLRADAPAEGVPDDGAQHRAEERIEKALPGPVDDQGRELENVDGKQHQAERYEHSWNDQERQWEATDGLGGGQDAARLQPGAQRREPPAERERDERDREKEEPPHCELA